jgi:ubiquinone/menaquinone biosynthesis C-methylase UbiE
MGNTFKDHFSEVPQQYGQYRPQYPDSLFQYLSSLTQQHACAWDCATGTDQAAATLAGYYSQVIATDASDAQIKTATLQDGITYKTALAKHSGIARHSIDLITVAQALHWFDL